MPASEARRERREQERILDYSVAIGAEPYLSSTSHLGKLSALEDYQSTWRADLLTLAMTRRHWEGLPEGIDARYLEKLLVLYGAAVIYYNDEYSSYMAQLVEMDGGQDAQENYPKIRAMGADGTSSGRILTPSDSVIIYDNLLRVPVTTLIQQWASDLGRLDLEIARNIALQNAYSILYVDQSSAEDAKKMLSNSQTGIVGQLVLKNNDAHADSIITPGTIQTGVTPIMDKLYYAMSEKLNQIYNKLGIDYVPHEKKERLVAQEAAVGADSVLRHRYSYLQPAQQACDAMHKIFGISPTVSWNTTSDLSQDGGDHDTASAL